MKKVLIFTNCLIPAVVFSQSNILNGDFEDTVIIYDQQNSSTDTSFNLWTMSSFGANVTDDAFSGQSAACIWNWYYYAKGELTNGNAEFPSAGGTPVSFAPEAMTGYYKYIFGENDGAADSAVAEVWILKYNTSLSRRDTLGYGMKKLPPVPDYTAFTVDISYFGTATPDTVLLRFQSSVNGFCNAAGGGNCLYLYLDDITVSDHASGLTRKIHLESNLKIHPAIASEYIIIDEIPVLENRELTIFNATGKILFREKLQIGGSIDIRDFPAGIYFVQIGEKAGRFIKR